MTIVQIQRMYRQTPLDEGGLSSESVLHHAAASNMLLQCRAEMEGRITPSLESHHLGPEQPVFCRKYLDSTQLLWGQSINTCYGCGTGFVHSYHPERWIRRLKIPPNRDYSEA